jgi:hypothetical protein
MSVWLFLVHVANMVGVVLLVAQLVTNPDYTYSTRLVIVLAGLMCLFGAASALALLLWKSWGFYGLCVLAALWIAPVFIVAGARTGLYAALPCVLALVLTALGLRRNWRYLD